MSKKVCLRLNPYQLVKSLYWSLPPFLREQLDGLRYRFVRFYRLQRVSCKSGSGLDLSWDDFRADVLDNIVSSTPVFVFEPTIDWGATLFQRPQHMAMALGRKGCIVLYRTTGDGVRGVREVAPNVWLVGTSEVTELQGAIWCVYSTASLCSPQQMAERRMHGRVVYEYIDHIDSAISGGMSEVQLLLALKTAAISGQADYLVASSKVLYEELKAMCIEVPSAYVPNGVDVDHFRDARHLETPLPECYQNFRLRYRKIVGYFGAIAPWLWFDVMTQIADQLQDVGFVYIGPDYGGCGSKLPLRNNVLYLGAVDYKVLPAYAMRFDVCLIPFEPGEIAQTTSPLKLYEYFALGKPVVVTEDMKECTAFREVFSGRDSLTLIDAINDALLACQLPTYRESVLGLADTNTWDARADKYLRLISF